MLEAALTVSMLGVLMTAVIAVYLMGVRAWSRSDVQAELLADVEVLSNRLSRALEQSAYEGLSVGDEGRAVAILLPTDAEGGYQIDPEYGSSLWERYEIYYLDGETIRRREVPLVPGATQRQNPGPIEQYNPGGGAAALESYLSGGAPVAHNVLDFQVQPLPATRLVRITARLEKWRYGKQDKEKMTLDTLIRMRNAP